MRFWLTVEIFGTVIALAVLLTAAVLEPDPSGYGTVPKLIDECHYRASTGKPCLSCGMTTSFVDMIRLRPAAALSANPAGVGLFLITLVTPFWLVHAGVTRKDPFRFVRHRVGRWVFPAMAFLVIGVWIVRTLPL